MWHAAWIAGLVALGHDKAVSWPWLGLFGVLQILRFWTLVSLADRWTTRIIVLDEPLVTRGPFRYLRHPNYRVVVGEILVVPMVLG